MCFEDAFIQEQRRIVVGAVEESGAEMLDGSYSRTTFERRAKEESGLVDALIAGLGGSVLEGMVRYRFWMTERKRLDLEQLKRL
jgi:hypothetical protein